MERRLNRDRRSLERPLPPGVADRRQKAERRLPRVDFLDFDECIELSDVAKAQKH